MIITRKRIINIPTLCPLGYPIEHVKPTKILGAYSQTNWIGIHMWIWFGLHVWKDWTSWSCSLHLHGVGRLACCWSFMWSIFDQKLNMPQWYMVPALIQSWKGWKLFKILLLKLYLEQGKLPQRHFYYQKVALLLTRRKSSMLKYLLKLWVADKSSPMKSRVVKKGRIFTANPKKKRAQVNVFEECDSMAETHQYVDHQ